MLTQSLLTAHVIFGAIVLLLGLWIMLRPKGDRRHVLIGWAYVISMWAICCSAFLLVTFHRFSFFLMVVGVLTFYFSFAGVRVIRRKKDGGEKWFDWAVSALTLAFGLGLIGYGIYVAFLVQGFHVLTLLSSIFGIGMTRMGWKDLRFFLAPEGRERQWWLYQHISAMGGSYISAVTALAVQNGSVFIPNGSMNWLLWILPGIFGGLLISRTNRRLRRQQMTR